MRALAALWRRARHFHRDEALIERALRPGGRLAVFVLASALVFAQEMPPEGLPRVPICAAIGLVQIFPRRRNEILSLLGAVSFGIMFLRPAHPGVSAALALAVALLVGGCWQLARRADALPARVRRHARLGLHLIFWGIVFGLSALRDAGRLSGDALATAQLFAFLLAYGVFRLTYLATSVQRGTTRGTRLADHLFYLLPVWGGPHVPLGKGHDHLASRAVEDARARTACQLAGLKCLLLGVLWIWTREAMDALFYADPESALRGWLSARSLALPRLEELIVAGASGLPLWQRWACVALELVRQTLVVAILGHGAIGCLRLFGFRVFRNTYKPLASETLLDFWNRFYFYFKELLVEFFFFPVYAAFFRRQPRLRIVAAVFAAAFLGNVYFHTIDPYALGRLDPDGPVAAWSLAPSRLLYCALLAAGVSASMLRQRRRRGRWTTPARAPSLGVRVRRIAGVWLFYGLIRIWSTAPWRIELEQHNRFFLSLFGG